MVVEGGQVVVEPWQRQGSGSPWQPVPISKQLSPKGHVPPQTPPVVPQVAGMVLVVVVVCGQVVVELWHRHGSASPKQPTPISKQLSPKGHVPPQTPPTPRPQGASWTARFDTNESTCDSMFISSSVVRQSFAASIRCHEAVNFASALSRHT